MKNLVGIVLIFLLVFINTSNCYAIPADSLRFAVRKLPDDTLKVIELTDLSKRFLKIKIDTSAQLARDAIDLSEELNYSYGYAYALKQMGLVYKYKSEYDSSLIYYAESLACFDSLKNDSEKARLLTRMANVHKRIGEFEKSLDEFLSALDIALTIKDSVLISAIYNNLGLLYYDLKEFDTALEYHQLNLALIKSTNLKDNISIYLMNIGIVYMAKKDYNIALDYYKQALDLIPNSAKNFDKLTILHNIGVVYLNTGRLKEANIYYQKALELEQEIGEKSLKIYTLQGIGLLLIKTGKFFEGEKYLIQSLQLAEEIGELKKQSIVASNLQKAYEDQNQFKNSLKYLKLRNELNDSILSIEKIKQITSLEQKYEAEKREHQISTLEKEQALQNLELANNELENKRKSLQRNILIVAVFIVLLLVIYYAQDNKKRKKINIILQKQNKKILNQRKEIAQQNDKLLESNSTKDKLLQIISHDLRSPLITVDSIARLIPHWIEIQDYESLEKLSHTLELSINNVLALMDDILSWALSEQGKFPNNPEYFNLGEKIQKTVDVYTPIAEMKKIEITFDYTEDVIVFADINMLRTVIRNLLNNAVKFTPEKGEVVIKIEKNNSVAKVRIIDSGIGIAKEKKDLVFQLASKSGDGTKGELGRGLGLFFCKEFVTMNNGNIFIDSDTGKGTTIIFTLPLLSTENN
jgi:signal transduction histidine kinase/Tfp pilus assembly protein PilF